MTKIPTVLLIAITMLSAIIFEFMKNRYANLIFIVLPIAGWAILLLMGFIKIIIE